MKSTTLYITLTLFLFLTFPSGIFCQTGVDLTNGLHYYYSFNKSLKDASGKTDGRSPDAMYSNDRFGNENSSYFCNGSNPIVIEPINTKLFDRLTISIWVRLQRDDKEMNIISFGYGNTGQGISVVKRNGNYYFAMSAGKRGAQASMLKAVKDAWVLLVAEYDRFTNDAVFFIKTKSGSTSIAAKADFDQIASAVYVGGNDTSAAYGFDGYVDELRLYGRRLTVAEIDCLFTGCKSKDKDKDKENGNGNGQENDLGKVIGRLVGDEDKCKDNTLDLGSISCKGSGIFCAGTNEKFEFEVKPNTCADRYEWFAPEGAIGTSTTNKIKYTLTGAAENAVIKVRAIHKSKPGPFSILNITIKKKPVLKGYSIDGTKEICSYLANYKYKLSDQVKGMELKWILPEFCSMVEQKDENIIVKFTEKYDEDFIKVFGKNECGSSDTLKIKVTCVGPRLVSNKFKGPVTGKSLQNATYSVKGCFKNSESYFIKTTPGIAILSNPVSPKLPHNYNEEFIVRFTTKFKKDTIFVQGYNDKCEEGPQTLYIVVTKEENKTPKKEVTKETPSGQSFSKALNKKIVGFALKFMAFGKVEKEGPTYQNNEYAKMEEDGYVSSGEEAGNFLAGIHKDVKVSFQGNAFTCSYTVGRYSEEEDSGILTISGHISPDGNMLQDCKVDFVGHPGKGNYRKAEYNYSFEVNNIPADKDQSQWNKHYELSNLNQISTIFSNISYFKKQYDGENYLSEKLLSYNPDNNANSFSLYFYYSTK